MFTYVVIAKESAECAEKKLRDTHFVVLIDADDEKGAGLLGLRYLREEQGVLDGRISSIMKIVKNPQLLFTG